MGNRIEKHVTRSDSSIVITRYVRDASGNVLATYTNNAVQEYTIFESSRLGIALPGRKSGTRTTGRKRYELTNHLGNVLEVISDFYRNNGSKTDMLIDYEESNDGSR